ncbi:MAG: hypothetical protein JNJ63_00475 [Hyphomonadaceae bacterium]|nr:hypothetical protein [Hyphomonadaceae bacterium]
MIDNTNTAPSMQNAAAFAETALKVALDAAAPARVIDALLEAVRGLDESSASLSAESDVKH